MADLQVTIGADGSGFFRTLENVRSAGKRFTSNLASDVRGQVAGIFAGAAIASAGRRVLDYGGKVVDLSKKLNVSTRALQEFGFAADLSGGSIDDVAQAFRGLAKAREEALAGNQQKQFAFQSVGISIDDLKTQNLETLYRRIAGAFKGADFGAAEISLVEQMLGRAASVLLPSFKEGLDEAAERLRDIGGILDDNVLRALDEAGDKLVEINAMLRGPIGEALAALATSVGWMLDKYMKAFQLLGQLSLIYSTADWNTTGEAVKEAKRLFADLIGKTPEAANKVDADATTDTPDKRNNLFSAGANYQALLDYKSVAEQIEKITERTEEKERDNRLDALSSEQKILELKKEQQGLLARMAWRSAQIAGLKPLVGKASVQGLELEQAKDREQVATLAGQIAAAVKGASKGGDPGPEPDALIRVGNFLGASGRVTAPVHLKQLAALEKIERHARMLVERRPGPHINSIVP